MWRKVKFEIWFGFQKRAGSQPGKHVLQTCANGGNPYVEKSFPICSLRGLTPNFPRMNVDWKNLDLCATASPTLFVDVLMMTWTGGVNGSPQERADGYE